MYNYTKIQKEICHSWFLLKPNRFAIWWAHYSLSLFGQYGYVVFLRFYKLRQSRVPYNAKKEVGQYPAISTSRLVPLENQYPSSLRSFRMYDGIALNCLRRIAYLLRHSFAKKKEKKQWKNLFIWLEFAIFMFLFSHTIIATLLPADNIWSWYETCHNLTSKWIVCWVLIGYGLKKNFFFIF